MRITIEGTDGSGKTTIAKELAKYFNYKYIHYPYYANETGEKILDYLNGKIPWDVLSFQCLQICNRIQTFPEIKKYNNIIFDRYNMSTLVYGEIFNVSPTITKELIKVIPTPELEIVILSDKPYRLNNDKHENIDIWNKSKELYIKYAKKRGSFVVFNNTTLENCIEKCKRIIIENIGE